MVSPNFGGVAQIQGQNIVVSANPGVNNNLLIIRGGVASGGSAFFGEGFTNDSI
jgi:hypothetical protein